MEKVEKSETLGLIIGRMNPPHNGHLWTIKKALSENQKVLLLLWTPQKRDLESFDFWAKKKSFRKML